MSKLKSMLLTLHFEPFALKDKVESGLVSFCLKYDSLRSFCNCLQNISFPYILDDVCKYLSLSRSYVTRHLDGRFS